MIPTGLKIRAAYNRILALPEPDRSKAMANWHDARWDIYRWPQMTKQILADLDRCITAYEDSIEEVNDGLA